MELKSRSALLTVERLYRVEKAGGVPSEGCDQWNLLSIARENDVRLKQPKGQVVVAVIGDGLCGKSSFLNALAEEFVFPKSRSKGSLVQWAVSDELQQGQWPDLLLRVVEQFPAWEPKALATVRMCKRVAGARMEGLQLVEVSLTESKEDLEVIQYMLSGVDIVVCLLDSQTKGQPLSEDVMTLLTSVLEVEEAPTLHFVLAKADLVSRESDRIRLIAKASRMLQERLGRRRGFEILPVSTGDLNVLLDILERSEVEDGAAADADGDFGVDALASGTPKWDAGRMRTWQLAQDRLERLH
eukprot:Skav220562  [mRNA]  locus=scaffold1710:4649:5545:- [translate_table: standard]